MEKEDIAYHTSNNKTVILKMYMNVVFWCMLFSISGALTVNVSLQCFSKWLIPMTTSTFHDGVRYRPYVVAGQVNCQLNKRLCSDYVVYEYPSIRIVKPGGDMLPYMDKLNATTIISFVYGMTGLLFVRFLTLRNRVSCSSPC